MRFYGLKKVSLIDYPGNISCTLFTYGCNLRCPFCHNPELVIQKPSLNNSIEDKKVIDFLGHRIGKLDGIVITGGEPLMHGKRLKSFIKEVGRLGFKIKIDTNGTFPEGLEELISDDLIDFVAMDLKCSQDKYKIMGANREKFKKIKKSLEILKSSNIKFEMRTTVVPGIHNINEIKNMLPLLLDIKKFVIQNFVPSNSIDPSYDKKQGFASEKLHKFKTIASKAVKKIEIRNE